MFSSIGLKRCFLLVCPVLLFNKSLLNVEVDIFMHFTAENKKMLSSKTLTSDFNPLGKSLISTRKKRGPNM